MKTGIMILGVLVVGIGGVLYFSRSIDEPIVNDTNSQNTYQECVSDTDCSRAGCSGQICTTVDRASGMVTTCEARPEYACYQKTNCLCISGFCRFEQNEAMQACLDGLQTTN